MIFVAFLRAGAILFLMALGACAEEAPDRTAKVPVTFAERFAADHGRAPLDYADASLWACTGEPGDLCDKRFRMSRFETDGTLGRTPYELAEDPKVDCFFIYPTLDFNILQGANHEDMRAVDLPRRTIEAQAAMFSSVCRLYAPFYRQGTFGAYSAPIDQSVWLFKTAFSDVAAAFEHYLRNWNEGRPIVIIGHSQGAQHGSYLLHSYFDGDKDVTDIEGSQTTAELRKRLVLALPVGFNVYVPKGKLVGGSFSDIPLCADTETPGCVIHYRSYPEGYEMTGEWERVLDQRMAEAGLLHTPYVSGVHGVSCVNPGMTPLEAGGRVLDKDGNPLDAAGVRLLDTRMAGVLALLHSGPRTDPPELHIPYRYTARCREHPEAGAYLAIGFHEPVTGTDQRGDPIGIAGRLSEGGLGLHIYDFNLAMGDLVEHLRRRAQRKF